MHSLAERHITVKHFNGVDDKAFYKFECHKYKARVGKHARQLILRQSIQ